MGSLGKSGVGGDGLRLGGRDSGGVASVVRKNKLGREKEPVLYSERLLTILFRYAWIEWGTGVRREFMSCIKQGRRGSYILRPSIKRLQKVSLFDAGVNI